jgi:pimeloyl-ACP methyl ester carboxylesterase
MRDERPVVSFALIPGAGGDAWYWHRVVPELRARGHDAIPVTLMAGDDSAGWSEYADSIVGAIGDRRGIVLVAQSLAGFSTPLVCEQAEVELLVLVNAMIPSPGETGAEWWSNTGQPRAQRDYLASIGLTSEDAEDPRVVYFHDVPADVVAEADRRGEPSQSWTPMTEPWPLDAWPRVATRVVVGRDDRLFPAAFQVRVARERLQIDVDEIAGGHLIALSRPEALVDRLVAYVEEMGTTS